MRRPGDWMAPVDDRLLEVFRDEGNMTPLAASKDGLVVRAPLGRDYATRRCRDLHKYGLLEKIDERLYCLSDAGHAYLDEELDADTLNPRGENDTEENDS